MSIIENDPNVLCFDMTKTYRKIEALEKIDSFYNQNIKSLDEAIEKNDSKGIKDAVSAIETSVIFPSVKGF